MAAWENRIVGQGEEAPDQLLANPANWRIHPNGHVVDGHLRVAMALSEQNEGGVWVEKEQICAE